MYLITLHFFQIFGIHIQELYLELAISHTFYENKNRPKKQEEPANPEAALDDNVVLPIAWRTLSIPCRDFLRFLIFLVVETTAFIALKSPHFCNAFLCTASFRSESASPFLNDRIVF